ncbi:MAG: hypothetical protein M1463_02115 [Candidatus Thermoplasmatota archaeon]|nr:hypothetical protein [Candidatus Thermoplasmatota archaeon]
MNQVEIWFSIFSGATLKGASFERADAPAFTVRSYVEKYNKHPKPFKWRKGEARGS